MCKNVQKCAKTSNEIIIESETTDKENNTCQYCNKAFSRLFTLNRHIEQYCMKKTRSMNTKKDNNAIKLDEILYENKKILDKVRDLEDKISNTPPSSIITTNNTNNNIHVTNNILNFTDLNYDIDQNFMYNCLKSGFPGDIQYLRKVYLDTIPRECRPVRCLDPSRDKCMVRKNGEWIASTGRDIYRESLRRLIYNYLKVNNNMLEENEATKDNINMSSSSTTTTTTITTSSINALKEIYEYEKNNQEIFLDEEQQNAADIEDYLNEYSITENENSCSNEKMDEYVNNLNRITRMMEEKNVDRVRKHMNILLK